MDGEPVKAKLLATERQAMMAAASALAKVVISLYLVPRGLEFLALRFEQSTHKPSQTAGLLASKGTATRWLRARSMVAPLTPQKKSFSCSGVRDHVYSAPHTPC